MPSFDEQCVDATAEIIEAMGIEVTYKPKKGGQKRIQAIFDNFAEVVEDGSENGTILRRVTALAKIIDVPDAAEGDLLHVKQTDYLIHRVEPDDLGAVLLYLHKAA